MDEPLKVGDRVMIAYGTPCCGGGRFFGSVFTIGAIKPSPFRDPHCRHCHARHQPGYMVARDLTAKRWYRFERLKKLPPLTELEHDEIKEEAPA